MSEEVRYYKGKHEVKVVTKSAGYWIVEALEEFEDEVDGEKVTVKVGERRIVPSNTVRKRKSLSPPIKEHAYELEMEKKLKRLVAEEEKKQSEQERQ
jgi:Leu/Phe-tRNA-protein transferase